MRSSSRISLATWNGSGWTERSLSASRETVQDLAFATTPEGAPALLFSACRGIESICEIRLLEERSGTWRESTLFGASSGEETSDLEGLALGFLPSGALVGTARNSEGTLFFFEEEGGTIRHEQIATTASGLVRLNVDRSATVSILYLRTDNTIRLLRGGFGAWEERPIESFPGERASAIALAEESDGTLLIIFASGEGSGGDLRMARFDGSTVTYETIMPTGGFGAKGETFTLLVEGNERFLLYSDFSNLKLLTFSGGTWRSEVVTSDPENRMRNATLARAPSGELLVGYSENFSGTGIWAIYAARRVGGAWEITTVDDDERP